MTLNVIPNRGNVFKALGVDVFTSTLNPNNNRYRSRYIFFKILNHKSLWEILQDKSTKLIDNSTNKLVHLLKEAELGGLVLFSKVNE